MFGDCTNHNHRSKWKALLMRNCQFKLTLLCNRNYSSLSKLWCPNHPQNKSYNLENKNGKVPSVKDTKAKYISWRCKVNVWQLLRLCNVQVTGTHLSQTNHSCCKCNVEIDSLHWQASEATDNHMERCGQSRYWHCCWSVAISADSVCQCKRGHFEHILQSNISNNSQILFCCSVIVYRNDWL